MKRSRFGLQRIYQETRKGCLVVLVVIPVRDHGANDSACRVYSTFSDITGHADGRADNAPAERQGQAEKKRNSKKTGHARTLA